MRGGGLIGLLVVALIVGLAYKYYFSTPAGSPVSTPVQTINIVGVKNDLLAIGPGPNAPIRALNGKYTSLDELISSGNLRMEKPGRDGYTYEVVAADDTFHAIAHCPTATLPNCSNFQVDQTMEVQGRPLITALNSSSAAPPPSLPLPRNPSAANPQTSRARFLFLRGLLPPRRRVIRSTIFRFCSGVRPAHPRDLYVRHVPSLSESAAILPNSAAVRSPNAGKQSRHLI